MTYETIRIDRDARGIATLTLARAAKHNALSAQMMDELRDAAARLGGDATVRAVVLAAEGKSFCAGGDLGWMTEQFERDREGRVAEALRLAGMLRALDDLPKFLIGRVQGPAYGGGIGMMAVCDVVIAASSARFALTEAQLGMIAATISPYVLRRIGEGAMRRMLNARALTAVEASAVGLVSVVAAVGELDAVVEGEIASALQCAPGALAEAKALCKEIARTQNADLMTLTAARLAARWETAEVRDGITSFLAGRKPAWRS